MKMEDIGIITKRNFGIMSNIHFGVMSMTHCLSNEPGIFFNNVYETF